MILSLALFHLAAFIEQFLECNPLSQIGIGVADQYKCTTILNFTSSCQSIKQYLKTIHSIIEASFSMAACLQTALHVFSVTQLHAQSNIFFVTTSTYSDDKLDLSEWNDKCEQAAILINVISFKGAILQLIKITQKTDGFLQININLAKKFWQINGQFTEGQEFQNLILQTHFILSFRKEFNTAKFFFLILSIQQEICFSIIIEESQNDYLISKNRILIKINSEATNIMSIYNFYKYPVCYSIVCSPSLLCPICSIWIVISHQILKSDSYDTLGVFEMQNDGLEHIYFGCQEINYSYPFYLQEIAKIFSVYIVIFQLILNLKCAQGCT